MLPAKNRLRDGAVFRKFHKSRGFHSKYFILKKLPTDQTSLKAGIIISAKVGNAVTRNYYKRILRCLIFYHIIEKIKGFHLLFIIKKKILTADYSTIEKDFLQLIKVLKRNV